MMTTIITDASQQATQQSIPLLSFSNSHRKLEVKTTRNKGEQ